MARIILLFRSLSKCYAFLSFRWRNAIGKTRSVIYLRIYLAGLMFTVIYNNAAGILRALGRSDIPFRILLLSCGTNIVLAALFVGVFRRNIAGVGIATVISQAISTVMAYRSINRQIQKRCFALREMHTQGGKIIAETMRIGMAAGIQSALIGFSNIFCCSLHELV